MTEHDDGEADQADGGSTAGGTDRSSPADETDPAVRADGHPGTDDPMVVLEFAVPTADFLLERALREHPDVVVEFEHLVPTNHGPLPYLWATDGQSASFRDALTDDPRVDRIRQVATFDQGALYGMEWDTDGDGLLNQLATAHDEAAVLQAQGQEDEWVLKIRLPSRDALADLRGHFDDHDTRVRVVRLYDLEDPKMGQYEVTSKQRAALLRALEAGYFEVPRDATLEDVADELDISAKATSERLRRGCTNLLRNSLTIGRPDGVGLGEQ